MAFGGNGRSAKSGSRTSGRNVGSSNRGAEAFDGGMESRVVKSAESSRFSSSDKELESASERVGARKADLFGSTDTQLENVSVRSELCRFTELDETAELENDDADTDLESIGTLDINQRLSIMRADSRLAVETISRDNLIERLKKDTTVHVLDLELRGSDVDRQLVAEALERTDIENRANFLDMTKAKGFLQEEMIKHALREDFVVSEHTVKSIHNDGSVTYTDIEATAVSNIRINGELIAANEKIAIESKAGDEKYIASQLDHIAKQLDGMPEDSHRMLFVTADVYHLNETDRKKLDNILEENHAKMNVIPYHAVDLTDTIMHMDLREVLSASGAEKDKNLPDSKVSGDIASDSFWGKVKLLD